MAASALNKLATESLAGLGTMQSQLINFDLNWSYGFRPAYVRYVSVKRLETYGESSHCQFAHCIMVSHRIRSTKPKFRDLPYLQAIVAYIIHSVGGGSTAALISGRPLPWLLTQETVLMMIASYLIMFCLPGDFVFRILNMNPIIRLPVSILARLSTSISMMNGVKASLAISPKAWPLAVVSGLLSGTFGGVIFDVFNLGDPEWRFATPDCLKALGSRLGIPLCCSIFLTAAANIGPLGQSFEILQWELVSSHPLVSVFSVLAGFEAWKIAAVCMASAAVDENKVGNHNSSKTSASKSKRKKVQ